MTCKSEILAVRWQKDKVKSTSDVDNKRVCAIHIQFLAKKSSTLVLGSLSNLSLCNRIARESFSS